MKIRLKWMGQSRVRNSACDIIPCCLLSSQTSSISLLCLLFHFLSIFIFRCTKDQWNRCFRLDWADKNPFHLCSFYSCLLPKAPSFSVFFRSLKNLVPFPGIYETLSPLTFCSPLDSTSLYHCFITKRSRLSDPSLGIS